MNGNGNGKDEILTLEDVCREFKLKDRWVRDHVAGKRAPVLPAMKIGNKLRFNRSEVEAFMRKLKK